VAKEGARVAGAPEAVKVGQRGRRVCFLGLLDLKVKEQGVLLGRI
jgi:hypothetical protein